MTEGGARFRRPTFTRSLDPHDVGRPDGGRLHGARRAGAEIGHVADLATMAGMAVGTRTAEEGHVAGLAAVALEGAGRRAEEHDIAGLAALALEGIGRAEEFDAAIGRLGRSGRGD